MQHVFAFCLIALVMPGCKQNIAEQVADPIQNFKYVALQPFDVDFFNLPQRMISHAEIKIEKDPFRANNIQIVDGNKPIDDKTNGDNISDFDIDALKMVGSVQYQSQRWGLLEAPNKKVYTLRVGQRIDHDLYLVTEITSEEIYLINIYSKASERNQQVKILALNNN